MPIKKQEIELKYVLFMLFILVAIFWWGCMNLIGAFDKVKVQEQKKEEKWERIDGVGWRTKIEGGWLYQSRGGAMTFVPEINNVECECK
jgi:hypothetical protein